MANSATVLTITSADLFQLVVVLAGVVWIMLRWIISQERQRIDLAIQQVEDKMNTKVLNHQLLMDEKFTRLLENMNAVSRGLSECNTQMHQLSNQLGIFSANLGHVQDQLKE